ncbi:MAG: NAD(P)-binding domain-containing protein [Hyphomicrobiaceae bacterium]|nr:NAD(P)-binding domain-containing protein [Hyphomicrobiaceae bacterium]
MTIGTLPGSASRRLPTVGRPKVVITQPVFEATRALFAGFADLEVNAGPEPWTTAEVARRSADAHAIMVFMTDHLDAAFFASCPRLHVVGAALKGYDNIDVEAASRAGVWVTVVPDLLTVPTAELAIGLMLALGRHVVVADAEIRTRGFHGWRPRHYGTGLAGTTVAVLGLGKVGRAIIERLIPFGCQIRGYDASAAPLPAPISDRVDVSPTMEAAVANADWVVLALPLTVATRHIMGRAQIARLKPGALLVNPARGSLVDEAAVADAIAGGHLAGYAADVFECEDWALPDRPRGIDPRLMAPDAPVVLTPHIGSAVTAARIAIETSAALSILDVLADRPPQGAINGQITIPL